MLWLDEGNKRATGSLKREGTMLKPKQVGTYPDRDQDCQEAVAQGIRRDRISCIVRNVRIRRRSRNCRYRRAGHIRPNRRRDCSCLVS